MLDSSFLQSLQAYPGIFIAGTDTGVGKTLIAGALARTLQSTGVNIGVMKPVETGCPMRRGELMPQDACYLKKAAKIIDPLESITPYRFRDPIAPWPAAIRAGEKIDIRKISAAYKRLQKRHSFLVVEGVGGLIVPLSARMDVIHLIQALALPTLLVARSGLGTLNHTLLSLQYGQEHGIRFAGVILNETASMTTLADQTNPQVLAQKTTVPIWGPFPYITHLERTECGIEQSKTILSRLLKGVMLANPSALR